MYVKEKILLKAQLFYLNPFKHSPVLSSFDFFIILHFLSLSLLQLRDGTTMEYNLRQRAPWKEAHASLAFAFCAYVAQTASPLHIKYIRPHVPVAIGSFWLKGQFSGREYFMPTRKLLKSCATKATALGSAQFGLYVWVFRYSLFCYSAPVKCHFWHRGLQRGCAQRQSP